MLLVKKSRLSWVFFCFCQHNASISISTNRRLEKSVSTITSIYNNQFYNNWHDFFHTLSCPYTITVHAVSTSGSLEVTTDVGHLTKYIYVVAGNQTHDSLTRENSYPPKHAQSLLLRQVLNIPIKQKMFHHSSRIQSTNFGWSGSKASHI